MCSYAEVETFFVLSVKLNRDDGFHLDLEDYLLGLLQLASELVSGLCHSGFLSDVGSSWQFVEKCSHCSQTVGM